MLLQRGEVDVEAETSGGLVGDMDFSLVHLDAVFDDRESESGAAGSPGATLVDAVEALEEMGQVRGVYPAAIVREKTGIPRLQLHSVGTQHHDA